MSDLCNHVPASEECRPCEKLQRSADIERLAREVMENPYSDSYPDGKCRHCNKVMSMVDPYCQNDNCCARV